MCKHGKEGKWRSARHLARRDVNRGRVSNRMTTKNREEKKWRTEQKWRRRQKVTTHTGKPGLGKLTLVEEGNIRPFSTVDYTAMN